MGKKKGVEKSFKIKFQNAVMKVGYIGGSTTHPSYQQVCSGTTGHAEAIQIGYDPQEVSYASLVDFLYLTYSFIFLTCDLVTEVMTQQP